jgi:hypothetical protein
MIVKFRHGVVSGALNASNLPTYLQIAGTDVGINATNTPLILTVAHFDSNYLVTIESSITAAWVGVRSTATTYLYVDIDLTTAAITYGFTTVAPIQQSSRPTTAPSDQHWFDTLHNSMYVRTQGVWVEKARLFVGSVSGSTFTYMPFGSQIHITGNEYPAGKIAFDQSGKPISKSTGEFFTTEDSFYVNGTISAPNAFGTRLQVVTAAEAVTPYTVVRYNTFDTVRLARYEDTDNTSLGVAMNGANVGERLSILPNGIVKNAAWNFPAVNAPVYVDINGLITTTDPVLANSGRGYQPMVGRVIATDTITFNPTQHSVVASDASVVGPRGPQGADGPPGPAGPTGLTGPTGLRGLTGPAGPAGPTGAIGPTGAASTVPGPVGPQGPTGAASTVVGPVGPQGLQGPAGPAGPQGPTGAIGAASTVAGPAGPTGPQGPVGPQGLVGPASTVAGPIGPIGPQGPVGPTGPTSTVPGPQGPQGLTGPVGPVGAASTVAGPAGPTGPQGPQGPTGATGATGPTGAASTVPGPVGPAGLQGPAGADSIVPGPVGPMGPTGPSGQSITIKSSGVNLTTAATSLNFTGTGITTTAAGSDVTVTVTGNAYTLPRATFTVLGGVKVDGNTIGIDGSGVLYQVNPSATNLSNTPEATTVVIGSSSGIGTSIPAATTALAGVMTAADRIKLDGIAVNATANLGTVTSVALTGSADVTVTGTSPITGSGAFALALANTTVTAGSYTNANITVDSKGRIISASTGSAGAGATNLSNTPTTSTVAIGSSSGAGTTLTAATASIAGVMTAADKIKLDGIATNATANVGTVTSVALSANASRLTVSNSPITLSGTIALDLATTAVTAGSYTTANITVDAYGRITAAASGSAGGSGSVTSVSIATANGVSGSVASATTTPAITLTLGAITPTSVTAIGTVTGSNLSGTHTGTHTGTSSGVNTGDQTITLSGDMSGTGTGAITTTLANTTVAAGSYTTANITVDSKGRITAASSGTATATITMVSRATVVVNNGSAGFVNFVGLGTQAQIDAIIVTNSANVFTLSNVPSGFVLTGITVGYAANFNPQTNISISFPEPFGHTTLDTIQAPGLITYNEAYIAGTNTAVNISITTAGIITVQKTGLTANAGGRFKVII